MDQFRIILLMILFQHRVMSCSARCVLPAVQTTRPVLHATLDMSRQMRRVSHAWTTTRQITRFTLMGHGLASRV